MQPHRGLTAISASRPSDLVSSCQPVNLVRSFWAATRPLVGCVGVFPLVPLTRESHGTVLVYPLWLYLGPTFGWVRSPVAACGFWVSRA